MKLPDGDSFNLMKQGDASLAMVFDVGQDFGNGILSLECVHKFVTEAGRC